jgi:hypothetical protein
MPASGAETLGVSEWQQERFPGNRWKSVIEGASPVNCDDRFTTRLRLFFGRRHVMPVQQPEVPCVLRDAPRLCRVASQHEVYC